MYEIELSRKAAKFYQKADATIVRRLNAANHNNIKPLSGELQGSFRLRVGNIRIIYSIDDTIKIVYIEVIGFRGDVYKR